MKKAILIGVLISVLLIAGAYYYFFIMTAQKEESSLPSKIKVAIKLPESPSKALEKPLDQTKELKKGEKSKVPPEKEKMKTAEQKKEEPQKTPEGKKVIPKAADTVKKEESKDKKDVKEKKAKIDEIKREKPHRHVTGYRLEYKVKSNEEADKALQLLVGNGYHTAKKFVVGKNIYVIVSPFSDKWEAQFVKDSILKETKLNFAVKAVYR